MMLGLITDRDQSNVDRRNTLAGIGWNNMTEREQAEWSGNPMTASKLGISANLLPPGPNLSSTVDLTFKNSAVIATAKTGGTNLYGIVVVGAAADYVGKTVYLSVGLSSSSDRKVSLYWYDSTGADPTGIELGTGLHTNGVLNSNPNNRQNLALYIYAAQDTSVKAGDSVKYDSLMFTTYSRSVWATYKPYEEIVATDATKGAYNYSDLNRVERAVAELSLQKGLALTTKTDWSGWDIPTTEDMSRYLGNIAAIMDAYSLSFELPESMANLTYESANTIEKVLARASEIAGI